MALGKESSSAPASIAAVCFLDREMLMLHAAKPAVQRSRMESLTLRGSEKYAKATLSMVRRVTREVNSGKGSFFLIQMVRCRNERVVCTAM